MTLTIATYFSNYTQAERAVQQLNQQSGILGYSLILQQRVWHQALRTAAQKNKPHLMSPGSIRRARLDSLMGLLVGVGSRGMANLGRVMVAGPLAAWLDQQKPALQQDLLRAFMALGMRDREALAAERAVQERKVVILIHMSQDTAVWSTLEQTGAKQIAVLADTAVTLPSQ
ncbi:MAG: hypothetical protein KDD89_08685 [Anaerolineales bacterium]|nr:hypothetical protein [Anaerolineales bacterium]